jgi:hypothetical protein
VEEVVDDAEQMLHRAPRRDILDHMILEVGRSSIWEGYKDPVGYVDHFPSKRQMTVDETVDDLHNNSAQLAVLEVEGTGTLCKEGGHLDYQNYHHAQQEQGGHLHGILEPRIHHIERGTLCASVCDKLWGDIPHSQILVVVPTQTGGLGVCLCKWV